MAKDKNGLPDSVQFGIPKLDPTPSGWKRIKLGQLVNEEKRPAKLQQSLSYRLVTVKRSRGGVQLREFLQGQEIAVKSQFFIKADDFLISKRQIVHGACGVVPIELDGSIVSNEYAVLTVNVGFELQYLQYLSETVYFQQTCFHSSIGVHIEKMLFKLDKWFEWPFNIPPHLEQRKIAQILSTWDKAIATTERLLANKQQQKKALMQRLLTGKQRFAGFESEWHNGNLNELCTLKGGNAFKEDLQGSMFGDYPFIKVSDMNLVGNETYIFTSNNWLSAEVAANIRAKPFPNGSIVFAKVGAALLLNRRRILTRETIIDNNMMAAVPKDGVDTQYLYQLLLSIDFAKLVQEGAVPSVNQSDLCALKVRFPPYEEQRKIAHVLMCSDSQIEKTLSQLENLKSQKKALMQQLLTGKRRVKVDEAA